jgi:nucleoside-diphosphate-sugar epimerase
MFDYHYTVIGASGFIGRRLVTRLRETGYTVFAPQRDDPALFSDHLGKVFYCAGLTADYAARPFDTIQAHVTLLCRVLQEAHFERLVYLSSTRLYDGLGIAVANEEVTLALNPANPRHLYDLSKALGENTCLHASGGRAAVARLGCVYDWHDDATGFLSQWLLLAAQDKTFCLDSSTGVVRDYIHVEDVVTALGIILNQHTSGIVNVASGENVSNLELATVFNQCGWPVQLANDTPRQAAPVCNIQRILLLGLKPKRVRNVVETYLKTIESHATD